MNVNSKLSSGTMNVKVIRMAYLKVRIIERASQHRLNKLGAEGFIIASNKIFN